MFLGINLGETTLRPVDDEALTMPCGLACWANWFLYLPMDSFLPRLPYLSYLLSYSFQLSLLLT